MNKPTPPILSNVSLKTIQAIDAYGEAMAAWGAAQYKEDAERYRHLKAKCVREAQPDDGTLLIHFVCDFENYDDIDAAIDKARKSAAVDHSSPGG